MSEFKREKRYQVTKLSNPNWKGSCVVVEDDWPEYEIVWKMIQDRVEGKPNIIEQQAAQIAKLEAAIKEHSEPVAHVRGQDSLPNAFGKVTRELYIQEIFSKLIPPEGTELYTHPILEK